MILDATETVLGMFGFKRENYGFKPKIKSFKEYLWEEIKREIQLEVESEESCYDRV